MTNEEDLVSKDGVINQIEPPNADTSECQVTEEIQILALKDASGEEVSRNCHNPVSQTRDMVYFYLLLPIILVALYMAGELWFLFYPSIPEGLSYLYYPTFCILSTTIFIAPLYILQTLWRYYLGKPLYGMNKTIICVVIFCIWLCGLMLYFEKNNLLENSMYWIYTNAKPIFCVIVILFLVSVFKACFIVLGYKKSKHSFKIDILSCTALCVVYIVICNFFMREGGIIYLVPYSKHYGTTEDFPVDKRSILKSFYKLAELNGFKRERFFHPEKQISYEDLLAMAAISPELLSHGYNYYPKFYARYLIKEILYPLSNDLSQKEYWGRKLVISSERIEDHFYNRRWTMSRDIFLARKYFFILGAMTSDNPEAVYRQWIRDQSTLLNWGSIPPPPMTPEEEEEWLYWYKVLWPQIEEIIDSTKTIEKGEAL